MPIGFRRLMLRAMGLHRLDPAVRHLLMTNVNVMSSLPDGPMGNAALRSAFFSLIDVFNPRVFCDIGANDGSTALQVKRILPDCQVYAFEANPEIHARHAEAMQRAGVVWRNLAIADRNGKVPIYSPRTLSRIYMDGRLVPASVTVPADSGKTSLLKRDEDATYATLETEATTLDRFLPRDRGSGRRTFLWIDAEGAADRVLRGATRTLSRTAAIFLECENFAFWKDQTRCGEIVETLFDHGFLPLIRDREYSDFQFNMLFVHCSVASLVHPLLFDRESPVRRCLGVAHEHAAGAQQPFHSIPQWRQADVPVIVPCFNNPTYSQSMLNQLQRLGFQRIVYVDNASTSAEMLDWLRQVGRQATIIILKENLGPRHAAMDPTSLALLPRHFCITDPDLLFNPDLPPDFVAQLAALAEREKIGKAGFALDISDRAAMRDDYFRIGKGDFRIWEWEQKYWDHPIAPLPAGDPVYRAPIDTTFALYDRKYFTPDAFTAAVRVAGKFTARHLPWYRDRGVPAGELAFYARTEKFSFYQKD